MWTNAHSFTHACMYAHRATHTHTHTTKKENIFQAHHYMKCRNCYAKNMAFYLRCSVFQEPFKTQCFTQHTSAVLSTNMWWTDGKHNANAERRTWTISGAHTTIITFNTKPQFHKHNHNAHSCVSFPRTEAINDPDYNYFIRQQFRCRQYWTGRNEGK